MQNVLRKIGLTDNEIKIFLVLLEYGARPASFIASKAEINRGTTYSVLKTLIEKKLAHQTIKADTIQFSAHRPDQLLRYLDHESHRLTNLKSEVEEILPDLEALEDQFQTWKPRFRYFEGQKNMQDLLSQCLSPTSGHLYSFMSMKDADEVFGRDFFEQQINARIARGVWLHVIRSSQQEYEPNRWPHGPREKRKVRFLPPEVTPPDMTFYLWDDTKCAFFSSKKESYGLLIESPNFYHTQKVLWDSLWQISSL